MDLGFDFLGCAKFIEEPLVTVLNGFDMQSLYANAWYINEDTTINGNVLIHEATISEPINILVCTLIIGKSKKKLALK